MSITERSKYSVVFDNRSNKWNNDRQANQYFLRYMQNYFNDVLKVRGYVFLRDIYETLGFPLTKESIVVGWVYNRDNPIGDNEIDFMIDYDEEGPNITLDFNVDGDIRKHLF